MCTLLTGACDGADAPVGAPSSTTVPDDPPASPPNDHGAVDLADESLQLRQVLAAPSDDPPTCIECPAERLLADRSITLPTTDGPFTLRLGPPLLVGSDVVNAHLLRNQVSISGHRWSLSFELSEDATSTFADVTTHLASTAPPANAIAIVIDGCVISAPMVQEPITTGGFIIPVPSRGDGEALIDAMAAGPTGCNG